MQDEHSGQPIKRVAFLGTHTPRQCGIATFTADLRAAVRNLPSKLTCPVVAMDDVGKHYLYPEHVRCQISEEILASYRRAADYLNVTGVDVLSLQHEFGIFGGKEGAHVLTLLRGLRMPVVTTLHTVLPRPNLPQRAVMGEICALSERLVVMSASGVELLTRVYGVDEEKVDVIPHGIPRLPDAVESRSKLGLDGRIVLLTFGLLSPDKGIEHVIDALPAIVERHPNLLYVVLGATHPHVREQHGEAYRLMLEARGERLGVSKHLVFHDRFVGHTELVEFLAATDIYATPYLNAEQSTSGTLAYAVGSGKVAISSPYRYATELLAEGRGILVPAASSSDIAREVVALVEDEARAQDIRQRAAKLGQSMQWPVVARAYEDSFRKASVRYGVRGCSERVAKRSDSVGLPLPEVNLSHLRRLTDDTGLLQHAVFSVPRYEDGYCLDDNARALLLASMVEEARIESPAEIRALATRYLAFVRYAFDVESGRFRNFMSYARQWTEAVGSEDSHGRALWALGTVVGRSGDAGRRALAQELFGWALPAVDAFTSPRAWAYALLGVAECVASHAAESPLRNLASKLALRLFRQFGDVTPDWPWCENQATYCNARIPQALMVSGLWMRDRDMVSMGVRSLEWLAATQNEGGVFAPIGTNGFFERGRQKSHYDQQPVEACGMVAACLQAHRVTGESAWLKRGGQAFDWFLGRNMLDQWLYDAGTGGCHDGLHIDRRNENQGAESTLSFLMALMDMRQWDRLVDSVPHAQGRSSRSSAVLELLPPLSEVAALSRIPRGHS